MLLKTVTITIKLLKRLNNVCVYRMSLKTVLRLQQCCFIVGLYVILVKYVNVFHVSQFIYYPHSYDEIKNTRGVYI